jgi:hypothetical protein
MWDCILLCAYLLKFSFSWLRTAWELYRKHRINSLRSIILFVVIVRTKTTARIMERRE